MKAMINVIETVVIKTAGLINLARASGQKLQGDKIYVPEAMKWPNFSWS